MCASSTAPLALPLPVERRARTLREMDKADHDVHVLLTLAARLGAEPELRALLQADICQTSGLHPTSLQRLVELWLSGLSERALRRIVAVGQGRAALGTVAIVAPGNLCVATWQAMVEALVCGNRLLVRPGSGDPRAAENLRAVLAQVDRQTAERIEIEPFERSDMKAWRALLRRADGLMVFGADRSLRRVTAMAVEAGFDGPIRRHGHGVSMAILPAAILADGDRLQELAPALAHDALLADGRGCLSLRAVLVEGALPPERWAEIADVLARAMATTAEQLPHGQMATDLLASRRLLIEEAEFVAATAPGQAVLRHDPAAGWAVVGWPQRRELDAAALGPGARCVVMLPLAHRNALATALAPLRPWLSTLAVPRTSIGVGHVALSAGFDRVCAIGQMQAPKADRPTNGYEAGQHLWADAATS